MTAEEVTSSQPVAIPASRAGVAARRRRGKWLRRGAVAVVALAAAGGLALALRPTPIIVETSRATRGPLTLTVADVGKARVRDRYVVAAPLAAEALRVELRPGDRVSRGGVIARLSPLAPALLDPRARAEAEARSRSAGAGARQARAGVARAELAAEHAGIELARTRSLVDGGALPTDALTRATLEQRLRDEELASASFAADAAAHDAAMAGAALRRFDGDPRVSGALDVTAPVDGHVLRVLHESAGPVQAGTPLVEIGDPSALEIVADILTVDAVRTPRGAVATVERWGGDDLLGRVRAIEPSAFTRISALGVEEQRVSVVIDLDEPRERWAALGDGYRVEVRIVVAEKPDALRVPVGALFRHDRGWAAYVVENDHARLVSLSPGMRAESEVEIVAGLSEDAVVVVHPSERVTDGSAVRVR